MLKRKIDPTPEQLALLPDVSDREMKRRFGCSTSTWARMRLRYGIEPFRHSTTRGGIPTPWCPPKKSSDPDKRVFGFKWKSAHEQFFWKAPDPKPDRSVLGEAASFLRRERFIVFHRRVQGDTGWQVGRSVLDDAAMLSKAQRLGFKVEGWMG